MSSALTTSKNTKYYINSVICILLMLLGQLLPAMGQVTELGMHVLAIYAGLLYGWSTVGLIWPSFFGLIVLGFSGYDKVASLITSGFGNGTNVYIMLICIFSYFVTSSGVSDIIVKAIITRKFAKGKPWVISWLFQTAAYVTALLISMTPAAIIVWGILCKYCQEIGYKKSDKYPVMMIIGVAQAALMGYSVVPYHMPAATLVGMAEESGANVGFVPFVVAAFLIGYGSLMLYLLAMKFIFRPDVSKLEQEYDFGSTGKMTPYQRKIFLSVLVLIFAFFWQSAFKTTMLGQFLTKLGTSGIILALLTVLAFFKKQDGTPFVDMIEGTRKGVAWPVFYCLVIGMTIATALGSEDLGIKAQILYTLSPVLGSSGARILLLTIAVTVILIATNFMGNYSCAVIMYTVCIQFAAALGISAGLLACLLGVLANCSIVFPSANPLAAMMHGMTDWVKPKDIYKYSVPMVLSCWICAILVSFVLGTALF